MSTPPEIDTQQEHAIRHWRPEDSWYKPLLCGLVVQLSRFVMRAMNRLSFRDRSRWEDAFSDSGTAGVLSFSNHVSLFDDPLLVSNLGATRYAEVRWIAADHANFFSSKLMGIVFSSGKCVPIIRGGGLEQTGFNFLLDRLREGDWVHIFPEGGRTREADARLRTPFKLGIGRLLVEAQPIAIPFYHRGMHELLPIGSTVPRFGKRVVVQFGSPTRTGDRWIRDLRPASDDRTALWQAATDWSEAELAALEAQVLSS